MDPFKEESAPLISRERTGSQRSGSEFGMQVHLYFSPLQEGEASLCFSPGEITAEEVCTAAAKECGILPVFHSLFALASEDLSYWFPPNHKFSPNEYAIIVVHYRVRFLFSNWYGQGSKKTYRYSITRNSVNVALDYCVIDYLFAQSRSDFVSGQMGISPPLSAQEECLGLAVLDLWRMAKERSQSLKDVSKTVSYKSCLPETHRQDIQRRHRISRYRIRSMLKHFLRKLGRCPAGDHSLKIKYLIELAAMEPCHGTESFLVRDPGWQQKGEETRTTLLQVSGENGIRTRVDDVQEWQTFCDFPQIVDISLKDCREQESLESRVVTVTRLDDRCLEAEFKTVTEALSFVSLVDGYFRLTTDSSHFFCQEVAPPSLLSDIRNHCHGPITSEIAVHKLKKAGPKNGMFLLRHSPKDYDKYFLTVCVQSPLGMDFKDCLIKQGKEFHLSGVHTFFLSLGELVAFYQTNEFFLAEVPVKLTKCCPPQPKEYTNMIIIRNSCSAEAVGSPTLSRHKAGHVQFQMMKYEDLQWGENLGQGSFTRIYKGGKTDIREGEKHVTDVLLKVLDSSHKDFWESFFEAASLMSQISHKHLLLVYGISIHRSKNIVVQEFVKCGALDLYLRKRARSVPVSWKLDVAKQLACVLNFLEEKNIVHGNICAKNLLLAREGDTSGTSPFIKLSDPGISFTVLDRDVLLDRIPWVAPEVLKAPDSLKLECDKWSFGTTLWEIFNGGSAPLHGQEPQQKLQFYENLQQLPSSEWAELADLIGQCMDYDPALRPSCRVIIRQLNSLITSDYVLLCNPQASTAPEKDSFWRVLNASYQREPLYEERHLRYIAPLGKGNFGSVELCRYDPLGDNTGELIAVKKLQPHKQSNMADFQKEIHTISSLHCDYIVKYRGICYSMGRLSMSLVMEYLPYGSLIGYLEKNQQRVNSKRLLLFASQICEGMEYLQGVRYVHRDLAARNILVASETLVKIADFGLTKILPVDKEYYRVTHPKESPIFWYAPESITDFKFSHKSDVWSFGIVMHELFSYCEHTQNPKRLCLQRIGNAMQSPSISMHLASILKEGWRLPAPSHCLPKVYDMMCDCWAYNSEDRPAFSRLEEQIKAIIQDDREGSKG
ncbi:tyrosine-protein kinase JAK2 [Conger conger]|uniref:tyrosine-protein kinase JAK2 n=1 Tax=Conger conger TaxID=82655 RepID=UPI002A59FBD8|nr:tyrosine-protein kinase JAK2 [Conger conger]XP_061094294.1 tyrosine-protein kinase JAK2 [Conger conger]